MRTAAAMLGVLVGVSAVLYLLGFALNRCEVNRRYREIDRIQAIIMRAEKDPTDFAPLRDLVSYSDRPDDWDRTQMFAQMKDLGSIFQKTPKARQAFEDVLLPVIKEGLDDRSGFVRREAALAVGSFGHLCKPAIPDLIQGMKKHPDEDTALFLAEALGEFGPEARDAIPAIEEVGKTWTAFEDTIETALKKIRGKPK